MRTPRPTRRQVLQSLFRAVASTLWCFQETRAAAPFIASPISRFALRIFQGNSKSPAYHDHLPTEPPPQTMDPSSFKKNRSSYIAYFLAAQIRELLYQEPCYCPCNEEEGHESLLDCFVGPHGASCEMCKVEVIFCFEQQRKGRSADDIRKSMAKGKWKKIDLRTSTDKYYALLHGGEL